MPRASHAKRPDCAADLLRYFGWSKPLIPYPLLDLCQNAVSEQLFAHARTHAVKTRLRYTEETRDLRRVENDQKVISFQNCQTSLVLLYVYEGRDGQTQMSKYHIGLPCVSLRTCIMKSGKGGTGLVRAERLQILLAADELNAIEDFRFDHHMPSRAAAVRELLRRGIAAVGGGGECGHQVPRL